MRKLAVALVALLVIAGVVFLAAGFQAPPTVIFGKPGEIAGAGVPIEFQVVSPTPADVQIAFEQNGTRTVLAPPPAGFTDVATSVAKSAPSLKVQDGPATVVVTVSRRVWGIRTVSAETVKTLTVRIEKPKISVVSTKHYINLGGSEMIIYRATPDDVVSGVRVGDIEYPGFPLAGAKVDGLQIGGDAATLRVAFFALRYDQDVNVPMRVFARAVTGEETTSDFDHLTFTKPFKKSTIALDDAFLARVVPAILATTPDFKPAGTPVEQYVAINSELRKKNNTTVRSLAAETLPELLWGGAVFLPFANTKAEAAFADFRTYAYQGREVDKQVHLGFDLASFANTPILAANRGRVVYAADLGIYGNCVIIDHGMGVQSLYGHLSSIAVSIGDRVDKAQPIGNSGMTGLAGGDHLHFTMLVSGQMVNPVEWWDEHWIQDRILRKLRGQ